MTDKELRRLKRSELLEIMFYLREELDNVKKENESLKARIDDLSKSALGAKTELSEECMLEITRIVRETTESVLNDQNKQKGDQNRQKGDQNKHDRKASKKSEK